MAKIRTIKNEKVQNEPRGGTFRLLIGGAGSAAEGANPDRIQSRYFYLATGCLRESEVNEMHVHDYGDEFIYVKQGEGAIYSDDGDRQVLSEGDIAFIPTGVAHKLENIGGDDLEYLFGCAPLAPRPELGHRSV